MSNFNYYDFLKDNSATNQWIGQMNKAYNDIGSPLVKIFKLDFSKIKYDSLYNEEQYTRVYTEPFEIRAKFIVNIWKSIVGLEGPQQQEDNLQLSVNFESMVQTIRDLKNSHYCELKIFYTGTGTASVSNSENNLILKENNLIKEIIDLTVYDTTDKISEKINTISFFQCEKKGKNDLSINLVSFPETYFYGNVIVIYSDNQKYKSVTDVIEMGDVIMTLDKRVYEIKQAYPAGNMGWEYHSYILNCELADMDKIILPEPYNSKVWKTE